MNINLTAQDLQDTKDRIFFIVGTSRSGSTLLQSMLSSHNEMVIPPETHFFHFIDTLNEHYASTSPELFRQQILEFWYSGKTRMKDLGIDKDAVRKMAAKLELHTPEELFNLHLTMYRKERGKKIVGEKTPRHILKVQKILTAYPNAKIISMFRDPRATAWSEIKAHFGSPSVLVTTKRWRTYVETHEQLSSELSSKQYMMIRYQDLIDDPETKLRKVCEFLEVDFEDQMLEYYKRDEKGFAEGEKSWKKGTLKPIQKDKNQEWKAKLKDWQISLVEHTASSQLEKMHYKKTGESLPLAKKLFYQCVDFGRSIWATMTNARHEGYKDPRKSKFQ